MLLFPLSPARLRGSARRLFALFKGKLVGSRLPSSAAELYCGCILLLRHRYFLHPCAPLRNPFYIST